MTKEQYLDKLAKNLKKLPAEDFQDAMQYYTEYFEDTDSEEDAIKALGNPSQVASSILAGYHIEQIDSDKSYASKGVSAATAIILSIFAAPIALPIAITLAAFTFCLLLVAGILILTFWVVAASFIIGGAATIIIAATALGASFVVALFYIGTGLALLGLGALLTAGMISFTGWLTKAIAAKMRAREKGADIDEQ